MRGFHLFIDVLWLQVFAEEYNICNPLVHRSLFDFWTNIFIYHDIEKVNYTFLRTHTYLRKKRKEKAKA